MKRIRALVICLSIVLAFSLLYPMYTLTLNHETDAQGRLVRRLHLFEIAQSMRSTYSTHANGSDGKLYKALVNESMLPHQPVTNRGKMTHQPVTDRGKVTQTNYSYNLVKQDTIQQASNHWSPKPNTLGDMINPEQKSPTLATIHETSAMATTYEPPLSATQLVGIDLTDRAFVSQAKEAENKVDNQIADGHHSLQSRELARRDRSSRIVMIPKSPLTQVQMGTAYMQSQQLQQDNQDTVGTHDEDGPNTYDKDHKMTSVYHTSTAKVGSKPIPEMRPKTAISNKQPPAKTAVSNQQPPGKTAQPPAKTAILNKQPPAKTAVSNNRISPAIYKSAQNRKQTNTNSHPSKISNPMAPSYDINATPLPIPYMGKYHCQSSICRELLSKEDMPYHNYCIKKLNTRHRDLISEPQCHYMNGSHRAAVALASLPGSGNTWLRGLLEQATGICTGEL